MTNIISKAKDICSLLRPWQWMKNIFIFLPLFFDGRIFCADELLSVFLATLSFCMASSAVYCFNDIFDTQMDSVHPVKCMRPIPSGRISKTLASMISIICLLTSLTIPMSVDNSNSIKLMIIIGIYLILNLLYCIRLKHIVIIDVFIIAIGFVLRLVIGGISANVHLTHWIVMMTFLLALFLAFAKRRDDVAIYEETGMSMRDNIYRYNLPFMNQTIGVIASITMVCYIMYTVSQEVVTRFGTPYLFTTSIFVLAGIIRYLQLAIVDVKSGSPTKVLLKDHFIHACIIGWVTTFYFLIYK